MRLGCLIAAWAACMSLCGAAGGATAEGETFMNEPNVRQVYSVQQAPVRPEGKGAWDGPAWKAAEVLEIKHFHKNSSDHRPDVRARLLYDAQGLYVIFKTKDRYVLSVNTAYQDSVCQDSCVEFFVQPKPDKGYFNFEINCGGTMLLTYIETPNRQDGTDRKTEPVPWDIAKNIPIFHSLPATVTPERTEPTEWIIEYFVPFSVFESCVGPLGKIPGQQWRANLYKCADKSSHPHWASWAPIGEKLSFHVPYYFGTLAFAP